ncbi:YciI family protein [Hydrogenophaga palleronii]|uniref:YciI family protein n=1 Tax=Hydrogenophaga palleronii TaxID=65655 RepID=UPI000825662E|nr:YciI family protein [Hydrogenophaga palleronii]
MSDNGVFAIYCRDRPDTASLRAENMHLHRAYLGATTTRILLAGPLMNEDRTQATGSLFIIEARDHAEARAFNAQDPFHGLGLWKSIDIVPFVVVRHDFHAD